MNTAAHYGAVIDPATLRIKRNGDDVKLTRNEFMVASALIKAGPEGMLQDDLCQVVWPGAVKSEKKMEFRMQTVVGRLRDALAIVGLGITRPKSGPVRIFEVQQ